MRFEYDPKKSHANKIKHGIDFEEAQVLWQDDMLLKVPAQTDDEPRFLAIGRIGGKHWSAVFVHREGKIRLISVRRSRKQEVSYYEGA